VAVDLLESIPSTNAGVPDRIEHGSVIPDDVLPLLSRQRIAVVGQPGLVSERGHRFLSAYPRELHPWLYRARSLVSAGILYAASSDAPVTRPDPLLVLRTLMNRRTRTGALLGPDEALSFSAALEAMTLAPARTVGASHQLGRLRRGYLADITIIDRGDLEPAADAETPAAVRATIVAGQVAWSR
jgi:predicted amidohydrolase YtcJ